MGKFGRKSKHASVSLREKLIVVRIVVCVRAGVCTRAYVRMRARMRDGVGGCEDVPVCA